LYPQDEVMPCPSGLSAISDYGALHGTQPGNRDKSCQCCAGNSKQIVCITGGKAVMVTCQESDLGCVNYGSACESDVGAPPKGGNNQPPKGNNADTCAHGYDACGLPKNKFKSITLEYTGNGNAAVHIQTKFKGLKIISKTFRPNPDGGTLARTSGKNYNLPKKLAIGDVFNIEAKAIYKRFLPGKVMIIANKGKFAFSANCKFPLRIGDEFGPFKVRGFESKKIDCADKSAKAVSQGNTAEEPQSSTGGGDGATAGTVAGIVIGSMIVVGVVILVAMYIFISKKDMSPQLYMAEETESEPASDGNE
jgi:hypothetical protein